MIKANDIEYVVVNCNKRIRRCDEVIYESESKADAEEKMLFLALKSCYQEVVEQLEFLLRKERRERWQKGHPDPPAEPIATETSS